MNGTTEQLLERTSATWRPGSSPSAEELYPRARQENALAREAEREAFSLSMSEPGTAQHLQPSRSARQTAAHCRKWPKAETRDAGLPTRILDQYGRREAFVTDSVLGGSFRASLGHSLPDPVA